MWLLAGWSGLVVGFFWSTVALWHATFFINSLAHVHGNQRYLTGDQSRNNWWLALLTFGEGWHNNHHYYQSAACQGFRWYEIDISFYILKGLAFIGVVHELKTPPEAVVKNEQRLGRAVVEKAAHQLAGSFHLDMISSELRQSLASGRASFDASMEDLSHKMDGLQKDINILLDQWQAQLDFKMEHARHEMGALVHNLHLPDLPDLPNGQQLRERALRMFAQTPSMNEILERARQIMIARVRDSLMHPHTGPVPASA
ncbi:acyl-CoA desaturase [Iodidimonas nitroreducens]|uniref:acyl-CoA desaturase n=1 Tax=Iodidimonas nitroreducens TaxID=1236968 RepID=UPI0028D1EC9F|nr:acyl-CoA desaturase [Iodidimonas nitroreducens]